MKKSIKRILSALLCITMAMQMLSTTAFATETPKITVSEASAQLGETFTVTLSLANNPGISCMSLSINYDTSALSLEGAVINENMGGQSQFSKKLVWLASADSKYNGEFATLTFKVLNTAKAGKSDISVSYADGDICNYNEDDVDFTIVKGGVTIFTETTPMIVVSENSAKPGESVNVTISLENNPGISCMSLSIDYDNTALKLEGATVSKDFGGQSQFSKKLVWLASSDTNYCGEFATLSFKVLDTAKDGKYEISVSYETGDICNYDEDDVDFIITNGAINVSNSSGISGTFVSVGSNLQFKSQAIVDENVTSPVMKFTNGDKFVISEGSKEQGSDEWTFESDFIYAYNMSDVIKMELMDGDKVLDTKNYCIREYCDDLYNSDAETLGISEAKFSKLKTFIADMLEFGAAAQTYSEYKTSDLANNLSWVTSTKTADFTAPESNKATTVHTSNKKDKIKTSFVRINECVELMFVVSSENGTSVEIANGSDVQTINLSELTPENGLYTISSGKLKASQLGDIFTVSLKNGDTILHQVTYSVDSYVASNHNSQNANLANICKALYKYGVSAIAYVTGE